MSAESLSYVVLLQMGSEPKRTMPRCDICSFRICFFCSTLNIKLCLTKPHYSYS